MTTARYVLCPGTIRSSHDGQWHYIGAAQLIRSYRVNPQQCSAVDAREGTAEYDMQLSRAIAEGLVPLTPRADGDYRTPDAQSSYLLHNYFR